VIALLGRSIRISVQIFKFELLSKQICVKTKKLRKAVYFSPRQLILTLFYSHRETGWFVVAPNSSWTLISE
jgi:hypothetical protein